MNAPGPKTPQSDPGRKWIPEVGPYLTVGMQLAIAVVAFFFLGRWLDSKFNTSPWLMIAGAAIGAVGGMISFLRTAIALGKKENERMQNGKRRTTI